MTQSSALGDDAAAQQIARYRLIIQGADVEVTVIGPRDLRAVRAKVIESRGLATSSSAAAEIVAEFSPYDPASTFILAHEKSHSLPESTSTTLLGMVRLIRFDPQLGLKTLNDLSSAVADTGQETSRMAILDVLGQAQVPEDGPAPLTYAWLRRAAEERFRAMHACDSLDKVMDIASLVPEAGLPRRQRIFAVDVLLKGMAVYTDVLYRSGELTHLMQMTRTGLHNVLAARYQLPLHNLLGLGESHYGMSADSASIPSVLMSSELHAAYLSAGVDCPLLAEFGSLIRRDSAVWYGAEQPD